MNHELTSLLVHDLKNPLAALLANLGYLGSIVAADEGAREAVDDCTLSTEVLSRLIDNLAAISRLGPAGPGDPGAETSVEPALRSSEARMRRHAAAAGLSIGANIGPDLGAIRISPQHLELAVDNLLASALAHAPPKTDVGLAAVRRGDRLTISVTDAGQPVSEAMRALVSDLEGQPKLKGAPAARYARGLGLPVAALVARAAGGDLVVASPEGGGCSLELHLPVLGRDEGPSLERQASR